MQIKNSIPLLSNSFSVEKNSISKNIHYQYKVLQSYLHNYRNDAYNVSGYASFLNIWSIISILSHYKFNNILFIGYIILITNYYKINKNIGNTMSLYLGGILFTNKILSYLIYYYPELMLLVNIVSASAIYCSGEYLSKRKPVKYILDDKKQTNQKVENTDENNCSDKDDGTDKSDTELTEDEVKIEDGDLSSDVKKYEVISLGTFLENIDILYLFPVYSYCFINKKYNIRIRSINYINNIKQYIYENILIDKPAESPTKID